MSLCTNLHTRQVGHTVCHWFFSLVKMSWWSFLRYIHRCLTSGYFHELLYATPSGMDCEHLRASWLCLQFLTRVIMTSEDVECGVIDCFHVAFLPWQLMVTTVVVCFWRFLKKSLIVHWWLVCHNVDHLSLFWPFCNFFYCVYIWFFFFFAFYCQNSHQLIIWLN